MWLRAMSLTACGIAMVVNAEALPAQSSRETSVAPRASRVDALVADFAKPDGPGASVVVALGDSIVFARGYGLADVEHRLPVTPSTSFRLASVTKQFTAAAILSLIEAGKLRLDDRLGDVLGNVPAYT